MRFRKHKQLDKEAIATDFLRSLDPTAYKQFLKAIKIYRDGDKEMDKFRGKNLTGDTTEYME